MSHLMSHLLVPAGWVELGLNTLVFLLLLLHQILQLCSH